VRIIRNSQRPRLVSGSSKEVKDKMRRRLKWLHANSVANKSRLLRHSGVIRPLFTALLAVILSSQLLD